MQCLTFELCNTWSLYIAIYKCIIMIIIIINILLVDKLIVMKFYRFQLLFSGGTVITG